MEEFLKSMGAGASGAIIIYLIKYILDLIFKHTEKSLDHKYSKILEEIKNINSIEKYKFERAHLKRIEIVEKIYSDIGKLLPKIIDYCIPLSGNFSQDEANKRYLLYSYIKKTTIEIYGSINFSKLYLPSFYINKLKLLVECSETILSDYCEDIDRFNDKDCFDDKFINLWSEVTELSKQIINEKDFDLKQKLPAEDTAQQSGVSK